MLSYRHAFHAGNHADVLKHLVLTAILSYFNCKEKPYWYIDTHAGAGLYSLQSNFAQKNTEFKDGIARLWEHSNHSAFIEKYLSVIRHFNPKGQLSFYPGSPVIAKRLMRPQDKLRLFELHPNDYTALHSTFIKDKNTSVYKSDGFNSINSLLPPPPRRGVILIDPPYENKQDYVQVISTVKNATKRFPTGCYLIWIPLLQRAEAQELPLKLQKTLQQNWLYVALQIQQPSSTGFGMHGSAMLIINPPYILHDELDQILPKLTKLLRQSSQASFCLKQQID